VGGADPRQSSTLRNHAATTPDNQGMRIDDRLAFRRSLRAAPTTPERVLWAALRGKRLHGFKFRRQHPVGDYVLDFYCVQARLAIEVDGDSHYIQDGPERDGGRTAWLAREGIRVLRFSNNEVLWELEGVVETIIAEVRRPPPDLPHARTRGGGAGPITD
jgi:very-short-patch-repair endonuclease